MGVSLRLCWKGTWEPGGGDYKGKDRSRVDEREKETPWNCFLTKFVLPPKAKRRLFFLGHGYTPKRGKSLFGLVKKKKNKTKQNKKKTKTKLNWFRKNKPV